MDKSNIENLVICSTLNQITNYLIIKKYKPRKVFNITFDDDIQMNINMKNKEWDEYLRNKCESDDELNDIEFENIELIKEECYSITEIKEKLEKSIVDEIDDKNIYWHITGGQRIISLAISKIIKNRVDDKLLYIEGNSENLIILDNEGNFYEEDEYKDNQLNIKDALTLCGFKSNTTLQSTTKYIGNNVNKKDIESEAKFYLKLYDEIISINTECSFELKEKSYKDCFWNLLIKSNNLSKNEERKEFVKKLFETLFDKRKGIYDGYSIFEKNEFNSSYPAGYIFEKVVAHKILDVINKNDKNNSIIEMYGSLKVCFKNNKWDTDNNIIDELDIVLLSNTGKIINFECKSGSMKSDNAKSHNYTTYRLGGVFGMPILLSPLKKKWTNAIQANNYKMNNLDFSKQFKTLKAAEFAELTVIQIDEIEEKIKKLLNL